MDEKLAVELAYKNGYEQGVKEFAERLKNCRLERDNDIIDHIAERLTAKTIK